MTIGRIANITYTMSVHIRVPFSTLSLLQHQPTRFERLPQKYFIDARRTHDDYSVLFGKGQMGSALMGSLKNMFFDRGTSWVLPLTYFYLPKSARAYLFPQSVEFSTFAVAPLVLSPFVRNQQQRRQGEDRPLRVRLERGGHVAGRAWEVS